MQSLKELYKVGIGPSSSHTIGPMRIAQRILKEYPEATHFHVALHGSLALTGKGHLTDWVMKKTFEPKPCDFSFHSDALPYHPNGMIVQVYQGDDKLADVEAYSVGGGTVYFKGDQISKIKDVYPHRHMKEILAYVDDHAMGLYDYVKMYDDDDIEEYLMMILD